MLQKLNKTNKIKQFLDEYILSIYIRYKIRRRAMTFLSLGIEKSSLMQEKSHLEYEESVIVNELNYVTEEMADVAGEDDVDLENNPYYEELQHYQELYNSKKEGIESQLKTLNAEIESYDKAVDTNIKSECKLSISV